VLSQAQQMLYLVDTDVLIDVSRNNAGAIDLLDQLTNSWSISIITAMELIVGARDKQEVTQIDRLIAAYSAVPLNDRIGNISYELLRKFAGSHGLRVFDSLIAATAIDANLTLITKNKKHFQMITTLHLEIPGYQ
jgi:predicted nucleic acid-binding protein